MVQSYRQSERDHRKDQEATSKKAIRYTEPNPFLQNPSHQGGASAQCYNPDQLGYASGLLFHPSIEGGLHQDYNRDVQYSHPTEAPVFLYLVSGRRSLINRHGIPGL